MADLATAVAASTKEKVFLAGHGVVAGGSSVAIAVTTSVLLERACRLAVMASAAGGFDSRLAEPGRRYAHTESDRYLMRNLGVPSVEGG